MRSGPLLQPSSATPRDLSGAVPEGGLIETGRVRVLATLAAASFGTLLPIIMVVANKSAPAVFGAGALFANLAVLSGGGTSLLKQRYVRLVAGSTARVIWTVLALFAASFLWTIDAGYTRRGLVEGLPVLGFALAAAAAWPLVARREDARWLVGGIIAAGLLIAFEKVSGLPLHRLFRARLEWLDLKRSAIPPALLAWPALAFALHRGRPFLAAGTLAAAAVGIVASHSGSPGFGLMAGCGAFLVARFAPRFAAGLVLAAVVGILAAGPYTGTLASRFVDADARAALRDEHATHRLQIWRAFEGRVHDRPLVGHGFDASYSVSDAPRPGGLSPGDEEGTIADSHPHNLALQLWVELGVVGAAAAACCVAFVLRRVAALPGPAAAPRLGLFVTVLGVGLVGLSIWQPWWIATIAVALLWFDLAARTEAA